MSKSTYSYRLLFACTVFVCFIGVFFIGSAVALPVEDDSSTGSIDEGQLAKIDPVLQNKTGETSIIVRFHSKRQQYLTPTDATISSMKADAAASREPLEAFVNQTAGTNITDRFWIANAVSIKVNTEQTNLTTIANVKNVERLHANVRMRSASVGTPLATPNQIAPTPDQSYFSHASSASEYTYGLNQIQVPKVWEEYDTRGEGATVAVLDSGVSEDAHPSQSVPDNGWRDFVNGEPEPYDNEGHGTAVSGVVVGNTTSWRKHYGVAPKATLIHGKVINEGNRVTWDDLIPAIEWAVEHDRDVDAIVMSIESVNTAPQLIEPIRNARESGIVVVGITGNVRKGLTFSPGDIYETFTVGAVDKSENVAEKSGGERIKTDTVWGEEAPDDWPAEFAIPQVTAPGVRVTIPGNDGDYYLGTGTSYAAPHVGGVVALMQSASDEDLSASEIESVLQETASNPEGNEYNLQYGHGIVNAYDAVGEVADKPPDIRFSLDDEKISTKGSLEKSIYIENEGGEMTNKKTIKLKISGSEVDSEKIGNVGSGESVGLEWSPNQIEPGTYPMSVNIGDTKQEATLRVTEPRELIISSVSIMGDSSDETVTIKPTIETARIEINISNSGNTEQTETLTVTVSDNKIVSDNLTLGGGDSRTVSYDWTTTGSPNQKMGLIVSIGDDQVKKQIEIDSSAATNPESTDTSEADTSGSTDTSTPGMGIVAGLLSITLLLFAGTRRV